MALRRLLLVRHAKAERGGPDLERPLARRGRDDAAAIGRWLAGESLVPDLVVISPARRTIQTWEGAVAHLGADPRRVIEERVYRNTALDLVDVVRGCDASVATLAVVGHNPSLQSLALQLAADDDEATRRLGESFPTSTLALFDVAGDWSVFGDAAALAALTTCRG